MTWKQRIIEHRRGGCVGAGLAALLGLVGLLPGIGLTRLSYDSLFILRPAAPIDEAVIVYLDDRSAFDLKQPLEGIFYAC